MVSAPPPSPRVYFQTLGCAKNEADSRALGRRISAVGIPVVGDPSEATHIVVNTCGFIQEAKEESIEAILSVCADNPGKRVLVMGCLVERYRDELSKGIPEVSGWFGVIGEEMAGLLVGGLTPGTGRTRTTTANASGRGKSYAYLKISDGCDEGCAFCAIPGFKGGYESVPTAEILDEADACLSEGARELVLVGQETSRWQSDGLELKGLIDRLSEDQRVKRLRVMYLQPARLDDSFLEFMAGHSKLCRYVDVPFQHAHDEMLRRMGRRGDAATYRALLGRARSLMPDVALRSTFIVGFPGERREHFEALMDFVRDAKFDYGGAFVYSPEEGTVAVALRPRIGRSVALERLNLLSEAILDGGVSQRARLVDTELEVMIDSVGDEEMIEGADAIGRTCGQAPEVDGVTYVRGALCRCVAPGDIVRVRISEVIGCDLVGEIRAS
jgi:ribosomal protein S12 methylthiotransferase